MTQQRKEKLVPTARWGVWWGWDEVSWRHLVCGMEAWERAWAESVDAGACLHLGLPRTDSKTKTWVQVAYVGGGSDTGKEKRTIQGVLMACHLCGRVRLNPAGTSGNQCRTYLGISHQGRGNWSFCSLAPIPPWLRDFLRWFLLPSPSCLIWMWTQHVSMDRGCPQAERHRTPSASGH